MNKQELCTAVSKQTKLSKSSCMNVIDATITEIEKALKSGKDVRMVGFGTWKRIRRKARTGRNPQTGKSLTIKARNVAKFSMGQQLFDMLN